MSAEKRARVVEILQRYTEEMEGYAYFSSNPGIPEHQYDEVSGEVVSALTPQWSEISTAPRDGTCILVRFHFLSVSVPQPGVMLVCWDEYYAKGGNGWDGVCDGFVDYHSGEPCHLHYGSPTHWLPLPAPPEGE